MSCGSALGSGRQRHGSPSFFLVLNQWSGLGQVASLLSKEVMRRVSLVDVEKLPL